MPDGILRRNHPVAEGDIEKNAADLDVIISSTETGHGSAVSIGQGVYLTAGHNVVSGSGVITNDRVTVTLNEGLNSSGSDFTFKEQSNRPHNLGGQDTNIVNTGNYGNSTVPLNQRDDLALVTTGDTTAPTFSMIVFENSDDLKGNVESAGYPAQGTSATGEQLYYTSGTIGGDNQNTDYGYDVAVTPPNNGTTKGLAGERGQSGSGVSLDYELTSNDSRMDTLNLDNKLTGVMVHGSLRAGQNVDHSATHRGAGVQLITPDNYGDIGSQAEVAVQRNYINESVINARANAKSAGNRLNRAQRTAVAQNAENNPLDAEGVADRFADNVMVSNQQGVDGSSSTFDGSIFNETNYANQNVNTDYDMKGGYDTADYFVVGAGKGITVEIGRDDITVQKSYTTEEQIQKDVVTDGVTTQQTVTEIKSHSATDTWENTEAVIGTGSDDSFIINDLSGVEKLDGRDLPPKADGTDYAENDSLSLGEDVGPVTWEFDKNADGSIDRENGWVSNGTNRVRFENMETVNTRDGDTVDGAVQGAAPEITPIPTPTPLKTGEVRTEEAIEMLASDSKLLEAAYTGGERSPVHEAIQHPDAAAMFDNLYNNGVETIPANITPDMATEDRVSELLTAGHNATLQAGIDMPAQQRASQMAEQQATQSYEEDFSYGAA